LLVNVKCLEEVVIGLTAPDVAVSVTVPRQVVGTDVTAAVGPTLAGLMHATVVVVVSIACGMATAAPWILSETVAPLGALDTRTQVFGGEDTLLTKQPGPEG